MMQSIIVEGQTGRSHIMVGESLANLSNHLPPGRTIIITDENVARLYQDQFPDCDVITIGLGEKIKTLITIENIFDQLINLEADRTTFIVGVGGGIVGDITGFAASTYMRGVRFGFVPTTLLAQVDATVGGKNGVNFKGFKNMVGVFNQPQFVIADIDVLKTLPPEEIACGLAEIVKHACIMDAAYFGEIENQCDAIARLDAAVMRKLVYDSVVIKADVVNQDEREAGVRRKLNYGHTLGHALEKTLGISHGEAVSVGMVLAAELSMQKGFISHQEVERIRSLLTRLHLPLEVDFDRQAVVDALGKDKKRESDNIKFVLLKEIGQAVIEDIAIEELRRWIMER
ncbi:MAG: 3-dehydroquinate synthase [Desulfobacteraceae bacterium]|jgi:3-dehydroquinate synthase